MTAGLVDLTDTDLFVHGDPHAVWAYLRANEPVHWNPSPDGGFWSLTRYADIHDVYVDPGTFSSEQGTVMGGSFGSAQDSATGQMLICADPPEHRLLRQQVKQGFANSMLALIGESVRLYADRALSRIVADGGGDFAVDVAPELPAGVLAAMFGLSAEDAHYLLALTRNMIGSEDGEYNDGDLALVTAQVEIFDFLAELADSRKDRPGHDLVTMLLNSCINGYPMSDAQILYNCLNVVVGGNETTPYTACAGVAAFAEFPGEADRFYASPEVLPTAVDEILRWTSTNAYVQRTATRDVVIRGVPIAAGSKLTLWNASANRDEEVFDRADRFDVTRTPNHHIAFGVGNHRCIGQTVARQEVTILFDLLRERGIRFELDGPIERLRSNFMLGTKHMPVRVV
ncbi:cytochrome P450 [Lentzea sp. NBRC 105346]|uniref:cytochrome P450 n=1 Tax=Lentzea sp. NBRC 105346 TaxID=3032205 RepID=UPI0024A0EAD9|nr:cytochrome P450 [Lentzea sp. NBRC 105346]GLZ35169.1 cytochrome P450 [Lentzea sp. NBRC 105346]